MPEYRKKPVVIKAVRCSDALMNAANHWHRLPVWLIAAYDSGDIIFASDHILITTLEGTMRADRSDMVIQGVKGEIYPCKPDIFYATYDAVSPAERRKQAQG